MQERKISFFGEKIDGMVLNAQEVANNLNFSNKVEDTISELWGVIGVSIDSVIASCNKEPEKETEEDDHFSQPDIEDLHEETHEEPAEISVDDLIAESYTYGKSDEQIADEFRNDLRDTVRHYGWLLVALGIALDHEEKRQIVAILKEKTQELQKRAEILKIREQSIAKKENER